MEIRPTGIESLLVIEPAVFGDSRGFFSETWNQHDFSAAVGSKITFVQDNHSRSARGVLRGLHYQIPPAAQGKLVRVVHGAVFDVAVDIRDGSPTFGRWFGIELSADNHRQLWVPPGFAHGFMTLSETADFVYKVTTYYSPEHERAIRWDDPAIGIEWPTDGSSPMTSEKDRTAPLLVDAVLPENWGT